MGSSHPRRIRSTGERHFVRVAAGKAHSMALTGSGRVYSWGAGTFGARGEAVWTPALAARSCLLAKFWQATWKCTSCPRWCRARLRTMLLLGCIMTQPQHCRAVLQACRPDMRIVSVQSPMCMADTQRRRSSKVTACRARS